MSWMNEKLIGVFQRDTSLHTQTAFLPSFHLALLCSECKLVHQKRTVEQAANKEMLLFAFNFSPPKFSGWVCFENHKMSATQFHYIKAKADISVTLCPGLLVSQPSAWSSFSPFLKFTSFSGLSLCFISSVYTLFSSLPYYFAVVSFDGICFLLSTL